MKNQVFDAIRKRKELVAAFLAVVMALLIAADALTGAFGIVRAESVPAVPLASLEDIQRCLLDDTSPDFDLAGRYTLAADLDLAGLTTSIGSGAQPFTGSLDGAGHLVTGLTRPLFGVLGQGAEVRDLLLDDVLILEPVTWGDETDGYADAYAALAGFAYGAHIENCGAVGQAYVREPVETEVRQLSAAPEQAAQPGEADEPAQAPEAKDADSEPEAEDRAQEAQDSAPEHKGSDLEAGRVPAENDMQQPGQGEAGPAAEPTETAPDPAGAAGQVGLGAGAYAARFAGGLRAALSAVPVQEIPDPEPAPEEPAPEEPAPEEPAPPEETPPEAGPTPDEAPAATEEPAATEVPVVTEVPAATEAPEPTGTPVPSETPDPTETPAPSETPDPSGSPAPTATPVPSESPEPTGSPLPTESPAPELTTGAKPVEYVTAVVRAGRVYAGGLVAFAGAGTEIENSFAFATLGSALESGLPVYAGGFAGAVEVGACIENCSATGLVDCTGTAAGFAAQNAGSIRNSFTTAILAQNGAGRAAFAANNSGEVTNCAYDAQMACADDGAAQGLSTAAMTGKGAALPGGSWHTAENAYPQLAFFASNENETLALRSKAGALALCLPEGSGLADMLAVDEPLPLPAAVDGASVEWSAVGSLEVNGAGEGAPVLQPAEEGGPAAQNGALAYSAAVMSLDGPEQADGQAASITASLAGTAKTFALTAAAVSNAGGYANWYEVGAAVEQGENGLDQYKFNANGGGTAGAPWLISTPEALAHLGYALSRGDVLRNYDGNYDSTNLAFTDCYFQLSEDLDLAARANAAGQSLEWWPVGGSVYGATPGSDMLEGAAFNGNFDGAGHTIKNMRQAPKPGQGNWYTDAGLFGFLNTEGVIENLAVEGEISALYTQGEKELAEKKANEANLETSVIFGFTASAGGVAAYSAGLLSNCTSRVDITANFVVAGGVCGASGGALRDCANQGSVACDWSGWPAGNGSNVAGAVGGVAGYALNSGDEEIPEALLRCANLGRVEGPDQPEWDESMGGYGYGVGGVAGYCDGPVALAYNLGAVSGSHCGGVVGWLFYNADHMKNGALSSAYNAGPATATGFGGVLGVYGLSGEQGSLPDRVKECYFDEDLAPAAPAGETIKGKRAIEMQTPAFAEELNQGAAALGLPTDKEAYWYQSADRNDGYPLFERTVPSWLEVGRMVAENENGMGGFKVQTEGVGEREDAPVRVGTPEGLAYLAYLIEEGTFGGGYVLLTADLDLAGLAYTGASEPGEGLENCLPWRPIGGDYTVQLRLSGGGRRGA